VPGFNPKTLTYRATNANSIVILVGDQVIGFAQTATYGVDYGAEGIYGVGSALPQEVQQLKISPTISLTNLKLTDAGLQALGNPQSWLSVLANSALDFHFVQRDGTIMVSFVSCTCGSYSADVPANQVLTETTSFLAMDVQDGDGNSLLATNSATTFSATGQLITNFVATAT
jgi:hypothetical protein